MTDIKIFNVTQIMTNCCYIVDKDAGESAVCDPGDKSDELIEQIEKDGGKLKYVLLTHGHYDHIGYAAQLAEMFGAKIVTGKANEEFLNNPMLNLSAYHDLVIPEIKADILLSDGDTLDLGNTKIKYISTPGHTSGCGGYIFDGVYICGDTLFCESYGRTDLPTGSIKELMKSFAKIKALNNNLRIIPGHGDITTLEHEIRYNPLMLRV